MVPGSPNFKRSFQCCILYRVCSGVNLPNSNLVSPKCACIALHI